MEYCPHCKSREIEYVARGDGNAKIYRCLVCVTPFVLERVIERRGKYDVPVYRVRRFNGAKVYAKVPARAFIKILEDSK